MNADWVLSIRDQCLSAEVAALLQTVGWSSGKSSLEELLKDERGIGCQANT